MTLKSFLTAAVLSVGAVAPVQASNNLLFILDASNSMWGQLGGVAKIEIAREAMDDILGDLPDDTNLGLMVYGATEAGNCADVRLVTPVSAGSAAAISGAISGLTPRGKTPIAASLAASADALAGAEGPKSVVLISDGIETCDGDACAAAERLAGAGIDVRVHVVGFDLDEAARAQMECITEKGRGRYFDARSTDGFRDAVVQAVEETQKVVEAATETVIAPAEEEIVVVQAETTTDVPVLTSIWKDDFDGFDLPESWTVTGPNPDAYVVEDGVLLALAARNNSFRAAEAENVFMRAESLPRGDWDLVMTFNAELQTGKDLIELGLMRDSENYLSAQFFTNEGYCSAAVLGLERLSRGEETEFNYEVFKLCANDSAARFAETIAAPVADAGAVLTLHKRGRSYNASLQINGMVDADGNPVIYKTEQLTSLRSPGDVALATAKWDNGAQGENLIYVDSVELFSVE